MFQAETIQFSEDKCSFRQKNQYLANKSILSTEESNSFAEKSNLYKENQVSDRKIHFCQNISVFGRNIQFWADKSSFCQKNPDHPLLDRKFQFWSENSIFWSLLILGELARKMRKGRFPPFGSVFAEFELWEALMRQFFGVFDIGRKIRFLTNDEKL